MNNLFPHRRPERILLKRPNAADAFSLLSVVTTTSAVSSLGNEDASVEAVSMTASPALVRTDATDDNIFDFSCDWDCPDFDSDSDDPVVDTILGSALLSSTLRIPPPSSSLHSDSSVIGSANESGFALSVILEEEYSASILAPLEASATTLAEATPLLVAQDDYVTRRRRRQQRRRREEKLYAPESAPISQRTAPIPRCFSPTSRCSAPNSWRYASTPRRSAPISRPFSPTSRRSIPIPRCSTPTPRRHAPISRHFTPVPQSRTPKTRLLPKTAPPPPMQQVTWNRMTGRRFTLSSEWRHQRRRRAHFLITSSPSWCYRRVWDRGR